MKVFNNTNILNKYKGSAIAIGNFDGVHKGHEKVFKETKKFAKKNKIKFGVLTFTPLPVMFFNKKIKNHRLASEEQKLRLFKKCQVDFIINVKFNKKFSKITAKDFLRKIIYKRINPKLLAVSNNFKFGKKRKGDVKLLKSFGELYGYRLLNIKPFKYSKMVVSSTKIRNYLNSGKISLANKLLSRTWFIEGVVKKGKKIGRKLGYRTCNINVKNYILPKIGIYSVKVSIDSKKRKYGGVAYLGSRPTFGGKEVFLEINIFGIKKNLYKKKLRVYFLKFLRNDQKFMNSTQLINQMNKDVISAKKGLKTKLVL
ncbi:bifunctional riboflavin kinase/FAD synthetase [Pelagibacteraceae bacterium]|nr:bifunctional riboflavin kinase/FAD synthetase [Pelagibacteraceae bacterium]